MAGLISTRLSGPDCVDDPDVTYSLQSAQFCGRREIEQMVGKI